MIIMSIMIIGFSDVGSCGEQGIDAVSSVLAGGVGLRVSGDELALGQLGLRISGVLPSLLARIWVSPEGLGS